MKIDTEMIDATGGIIPQDSPYLMVSVKESDCYALVDSSDNNKTYMRNPTQVVYESIRWASRMLKGHPLYWADKRKLLTRILRSANTALFTQCKEHIESNAVNAMVGFRGNIQLWLAVVGKVSVWNYIGTHIEQVYPKEGNEHIDPLGSHRYGFFPHIVSTPFVSQGYTVVSTGSISQYIQNIGGTTFLSIENVISIFRTIETPGVWMVIPHTTR